MNARCADRRAVERAIDLMFYAPVGLLALAGEQLPVLVERGRQNVQQRLAVARLVGQMTMQLGRAQVERRLATEPDGGAPSDLAPAAMPADVAPVVDDVPTVDAETLPIDDYESLAASQVVARLASLDPHELELIESFERATRNRRTVLGRIAQLRVPT